jgi:hypothetical protein
MELGRSGRAIMIPPGGASYGVCFATTPIATALTRPSRINLSRRRYARGRGAPTQRERTIMRPPARATGSGFDNTPIATAPTRLRLPTEVADFFLANCGWGRTMELGRSKRT